MREISRSAFIAARDVAEHDCGATVTHGCTESGKLLTIVHRAEPSQRFAWGVLPWLQSVTNERGRSLFMLHSAAPDAVQEAANLFHTP